MAWKPPSTDSKAAAGITGGSACEELILWLAFGPVVACNLCPSPNICPFRSKERPTKEQLKDMVGIDSLWDELYWDDVEEKSKACFCCRLSLRSEGLLWAVPRSGHPNN